MPLLIGAAIRDGRYIVESLLSEEELSNIYVVLDTQEPEKKYSLEELVLPTIIALSSSTIPERSTFY